LSPLAASLLLRATSDSRAWRSVWAVIRSTRGRRVQCVRAARLIPDRAARGLPARPTARFDSRAGCPRSCRAPCRAGGRIGVRETPTRSACSSRREFKILNWVRLPWRDVMHRAGSHRWRTVGRGCGVVLVRGDSPSNCRRRPLGLQDFISRRVKFAVTGAGVGDHVAHLSWSTSVSATPTSAPLTAPPATYRSGQQAAARPAVRKPDDRGGYGSHRSR
jgi:hypothetical protein